MMLGALAFPPCNNFGLLLATDSIFTYAATSQILMCNGIACGSRGTIDSDSVALQWGQTFCISSEFQGVKMSYVDLGIRFEKQYYRVHVSLSVQKN